MILQRRDRTVLIYLPAVNLAGSAVKSHLCKIDEFEHDCGLIRVNRARVHTDLPSVTHGAPELISTQKKAASARGAFIWLNPQNGRFGKTRAFVRTDCSSV